MRRILIIHAHPDPAHSQANKQLAQAAQTLDDITFVDLYACYPRFKINVDVEQQRLREHDLIVLQFPVFWYSTPSLLKEWIDLVLEYGFAYGPTGDALTGKWCLLAMTAGGPANAYADSGSNRYDIRALFRPLEQTARLCRMKFMSPFVLFEAQRHGAPERLMQHVEAYRTLLRQLRDGHIHPSAFSGKPWIQASDVDLTAGGSQ